MERDGWLGRSFLRVVALSALAFAATPSAALIRIGGLELGVANDVEVAGPLAYLATESGLVIVDVSDRVAPTVVGRVDLPGNGFDVEVVGRLAYVATLGGGLRILDVSDPAAPVEIGNFDAQAQGVAVVGPLAYLCDGSLRIIDVSEPSAPVQIGEFASPGFAGDVAVVGSRAYVADASAGLRILDVSEPTAPTELGAVEDFDASDVQIVGNRAHAVGTGGGRVVDVSNPASPVVVCELPSALSLDVHEPYAFLASLDRGLRVIDLEACDGDPGLGEISTGFVKAVAVVGRTAFLAEERGLGLVDLSHLEEPRVRSSTLLELPTGLAADAGLALVTDARTGLLLFDPSIPSHPQLLGSAPIAGAIDVAAAGGLAALLTSTDLRSARISDPSAPVLLATVPRFFPVDVELAGSLAFVAGGQPPSPFFPPRPGFFLVFDLSDPATPIQLAELELPGRPLDLEIAGSFAYVADWIRGLRLIDLSDPSHPVERAVLSTPGEAWGVSVEDDIALVAAGPAGLRVIDVRDPSAPVEIASLDVGYSRDVERAGALAWVAGGFPPIGSFPQRGFVRVVDVSDPYDPRPLGGIATRLSVGDVERMAGLTLRIDERALDIVDFGPEYPDSRVRIEIQPGVGRAERAVVRVALFGSDRVTVSEIDPETLDFGPEGAPAKQPVSFRDVDRDGRLDLVARFRRRDSGLAQGDSRACLRARLFDGSRLEGCESLATRSPRGRGARRD